MAASEEFPVAFTDVETAADDALRPDGPPRELWSMLSSGIGTELMMLANHASMVLKWIVK